MRIVLYSILLLVTVASFAEEGHERESQRRDSYLEAYEDSHGVDGPELEYEPSPFYHSPSSPPHYPPARPSNKIHPSPGYGPPVSPSYGPPVSPSYGPPVSPSYGPPVSPSYGPPVSPSYIPQPSPSYGPPVSPPYGPPLYPSYGPSSGHSYGPIDPSYGAPFSIVGGLLEKLNIHTILTILLKVTIFKLIVKFIAILCLLLFIPKFEKLTSSGNKGNSTNTDDERSFWISSGRSSYSIDNLTSLVWSGLDKNETMDCQEDVYCQIDTVARYMDSKNSFSQLLEMYVPSAETVVVKDLNSTLKSTGVK